MNNIKVNILGSDTFSNLLKELEIFNLTDPASKNIKNVIRIIFVDNYNSVFEFVLVFAVVSIELHHILY